MHSIAQRPNVLVTGGAGYVGSHVCKALWLAGYTPVVYDNLSRGHRKAVQWGPLEVGDIRDAAALGRTLVKYRPVGALHFAAFAYVGESVSDPLSYYDNNVAGTLVLLDALRLFDVRALVFSSTCAVFGRPDAAVLAETLPTNPINPYGRTKLMIESALHDMGNAGELRWVALRYFNAAGSDPDREVGEDHDPEPHLIPRALMAAQGRIPQIDVFGTDYPTPDGTCLRDYVHVSDLAEAHVAALRYLLDGGTSEIFNLGAERAVSVREVIAAAERVTGCSVPLKESPRRAGDPEKLVADAAKARAGLGFRPRFREIEEMVEHAWGWRRRNAS
jgi:UDP-arabinose 4-epimerase